MESESVYLFLEFTIIHGNPLNPPYQGDFGNLAKVGVIGKCLLISIIHYKTNGDCRDVNLDLQDLDWVWQFGIATPLDLHNYYGIRSMPTTIN